MLTSSQKRAIDKAWDSIWASGVTNPIVVLDLMATLLMTHRYNVQSWKQLKSAVNENDIPSTLKLIKRIRLSYGIESGSEIESEHFWPNTLAIKGAASYIEPVLNGSGDIIGDIFEHILGKLTTAGTFGQFRTPNHIVKFLVDLIGPDNGNIIMDPACGTGSFLIQAANYCRQKELSAEYIGLEIDRTITRIAQANVVFHNIKNGEIINSDGLIDKAEIKPDIILANPPFAGTVSAEVKRTIGLPTNKSELLFIKTMIDRLAPGGRAAVIVPNGVLTTSQKTAVNIREHLVTDMMLEAVIELPSNVFAPYTSVKTGILVWRNVSIETANHKTLMIRVENDGFSLNAKRTPIKESDLPGVLDLFKNKINSIPHAYANIGELSSANYNLSPSRYIEDEAASTNIPLEPTEVIAKMEESLDSIMQRFSRIKENL